ncbi:FAD-binding 8, partial [Dillenia turbinata]
MASNGNSGRGIRAVHLIDIAFICLPAARCAGSSLLIYEFPVLLVACLGCLYLHLRQNCDGHSHYGFLDDSNRLASWKRPALVKGPLGIVSWMELAFMSMFVALLVWSLSSYLRNFFADITPSYIAQSGQKIWQAKLGSSGLALALVGNVCLAFLFFPVSRGSSILRLIGLTSEASIKYHMWLGHITMAFFTAHGLCYIVLWVATNRISQVLKWPKVGISNVAGEVTLVAGLALWATTFSSIRRKRFELFFYTHHLYIIFIVFFIFHVGMEYSLVVLPGFYLFLVDRCLRYLQSQQNVRLVSARLLPCEVVELKFAKTPGLSYTPTSTMFVNVPGISKLQWHPFTITSNSNTDRDMLSVVIKSEGRWTSKLYQIISFSSPNDRLKACVEGPYGPASTNFLRHDMLVLVSGGSGITPFISIIRELLFRANTTNCNGPRVLLICAFKKSVELTMLDLLLPISDSASKISQLQLQIEAYITRDKEPATDAQNLMATVQFKPNESDKPIYSILGPNNWLWLSAIISSSFVIFLILIGIITQYCIYPIDHSTGKIYPYFGTSALYMLVICVSITLTATGVFIWNKRHNSMEIGQVQSIQSQDEDRELESLPPQSLAQATNVHYGERPNLKKILAECEGSSIGVLVSGPRGMRQEAAAICSCSSTSNLHFESFSFS